MAETNLVELGDWKGDQYAFDKVSQKVLIKTRYGYEPTVGVFAQNELKTHFASQINALDPSALGTKINLVIKSPNKNAGSRSGVLRYPSKAPITTDSDYVVFSFYKYAPPFGGGRDTPNNATANSSFNLSTNAGYKKYQSSNDRSYANPSTLDPIVLYMPEDIQSQFGAGWNGAGFGAAAAGMMTGMGAFNTQRNILNDIQAGGQNFSGVIKTATYSALISGINDAVGSNISLNQVLGTVSGTIINPNVELAYEAPKLRNFSLKFKLVPRSASESTQIQQICNTFKKSMLPSFGGSALGFEAGNLITIPDLCQVSFMNGNKLHPYLPQYKLCGITDVNINYTAAGAYSTVGDDGAPTAVELTLSFLETKLVFSDEVKVDGGGI